MYAKKVEMSREDPDTRKQSHTAPSSSL